MRKTLQADEALEEAAELREQVVDPKDAREIEELRDEDFDSLVAFWSK